MDHPDGSTTTIICGANLGGCMEMHRDSTYQFALSHASGKDGQKWCDKWAGPGSWSDKHQNGDGTRAQNAKANIRACKDAGRIK